MWLPRSTRAPLCLPWSRPLIASCAQPPCSRGRPEMALRFAPIAETAPRLAVDLVILMTLACDQYHIPRLRFLECRADGFAAVVNDPHVARCDAAEDGAGNGLRILGARIVVGDDDPIGQFVGNGAHDGTLPGVAVAAAPEHAPQCALAMLAQGSQRLGERVRRVCVVDHGRRFAAGS